MCVWEWDDTRVDSVECREKQRTVRRQGVLLNVLILLAYLRLAGHGNYRQGSYEGLRLSGHQMTRKHLNDPTLITSYERASVGWGAVDGITEESTSSTTIPPRARAPHLADPRLLWLACVTRTSRAVIARHHVDPYFYRRMITHSQFEARATGR